MARPSIPIWAGAVMFFVTSVLKNTLVYDGDCAFCTKCAVFIEQRLPAEAKVLTWQSLPDLSAVGLTEEDLETASYWFDETGRAWRGEEGIAMALASTGGIYKLGGRAILSPPFSWMSGPVYRWVSRNRNRMPGATDSCRIDNHSPKQDVQ